MERAGQIDATSFPALRDPQRAWHSLLWGCAAISNYLPAINVLRELDLTTFQLDVPQSPEAQRSASKWNKVENIKMKNKSVERARSNQCHVLLRLTGSSTGVAFFTLDHAFL